MRKKINGKFTLKYLQSLDTIHQGHFDNLKIDTGEKRVWLSRMTVEDGMDYDNQVTVERLEDGVWQTKEQYRALS